MGCITMVDKRMGVKWLRTEDVKGERAEKLMVSNLAPRRYVLYRHVRRCICWTLQRIRRAASQPIASCPSQDRAMTYIRSTRAAVASGQVLHV